MRRELGGCGGAREPVRTGARRARRIASEDPGSVNGIVMRMGGDLYTWRR